jgi:outer membrane protein OmpA-like peptidoglycan-associated protein
MKRKPSRSIQDVTRSATSRTGSAPPGRRPPSGDDAASSWAAFVAGAVLVFIVFVAVAVVLGTQSVESDIEARSVRTLQNAGFSAITADADGFNVALKGEYQEGQDIVAAEEAVARLTGVAAVDVEGVWEIPAPEVVEVEVVGTPVAFTWSGDTIAVAGALSSETEAAFLNDALGGLQGADGEIRFAEVDLSAIETREGLPNEDAWVGKAVALIGSLAQGLPSGSVTVNPAADVVTTAGKVETRQEKRHIADASKDFIEALEAGGFDVTDGVLGPPKPPPPTRQEVQELDQTLAELIEGKVVEFEFASDQLTDEGEALLDDLLVALREFEAVSVEIDGHADAQGTPERNMTLSQDRARAVVDYFVSRGEDPGRFIAVGYGDTRPIADNSTEEGRQKNRRIEFIALEG